MTEVRVLSFAYSQGTPPAANLVLDMRFLRNPHWQEELRELCGLDEAVGDYIGGDEAYADAVGRIEDLLLTLLPRYAGDEKAIVSIAFGCTGGTHRSVHVAEHIAARLRAAGFSSTVEHRDLATPPRDERQRPAR